MPKLQTNPSLFPVRSWRSRRHARTLLLLTLGVPGLLSLIAAPLGPANATTLLSEDFQSYASGSLLAGQGGWTGDAVRVNADPNFGGSIVADGRDDAGLTGFSFLNHAIGGALDPNAVTELRFDARAVSANPVSHNAGLGLSSSAASPTSYPALRWDALADVTSLDPVSFGPAEGWVFSAGGLTGNSADRQLILGGYDAVRTFKIVIDGAAMEVYGVFDFGAGATETTHFAVTAAQIASLDQVEMAFDFRRNDGPFVSTPGGRQFTAPQFDNLLLTQQSADIPEPAMGLVIVGLGLAAGLARRRFGYVPATPPCG